VTFVNSDVPGQQIYAWHQHTTDGSFEDVVCVPEGTEDAAYFVANRTIGGAPQRTIERLSSRQLPLVTVPDPKDATKTITKADVRFACYLDASLQADGRNTGAATMTVSGASYNAEDVVTIDASVASFAGTDVGDQVVLDPDGAAGATTRITITQFNSATQVLGRLEAPLPAAFQNVATTSWGLARDSFSGLDHLEGKAVLVLGDGGVQGPFTVTAGAVTGLDPVVIAQTGLAYTADAELLDIGAASVKGAVKNVAQVLFDIVASGGLLVGESFDDKLRAAKLRKVSDGYGPPPLVTDEVAVKISSSWNTGARAVIRQADPLPLTVISVTREVETGGRG
jgi:hypothetical protein